ncbi:hypothetical protein JH06_1619 [Blastocystis sp. subtype 4]|uniref:hypothetical protein n=1 Tax=Blastocystis sp. subtype 4 TaxID=944170 RepID=UPI0007113EB2|nr:hypothetical protein JH06_1619 [Blastocystis sp. subtype 4]KNB45100.1 hypothetical protein JH06_1619 [Blastocystis sp. subtype 4]|eukprot:XP_014528543.1 hypothetical protein JH06_1619 [Blastocystis sp. subtype 4]
MSSNEESPQLKAVDEVLNRALSFINRIPGIGEFDYFNLFPEFQGLAEEINAKSLGYVQKIYEYYLPLTTTVLKDNLSIHEPQQFAVVESLYDTIFEKMDEAIDMKKGLLKDTKDSGSKQGTVDRGSAVKENVITYKASLDKPQLAFTDGVDNSKTPFQPKLKVKHNAQMNWSLDELESDGLYSNPYLYELNNLVYPDWERTLPEIVTKPRSENATPLIVVETEDGMKSLVEELMKEKSIAVDLEHHNFRTYQGFTCLLQISTRTSDYLVDVIKARDFVWLLNEVFTNPHIMKVLHGADMDIVWLQKDFGVYMVNMFDTGQAARVLGFESFGLAYLLKRFCDVIANKEYQLADWRIRPLTADMKKYAREDTHYLLYISDELRVLLVNESGDRDLLEEVLKRSEELCKQAYQKPTVTVDTAIDMINKYHCFMYFTFRKSLVLNNTQRQVFVSLFLWRDTIAREADESPQYILPFVSLTKLAKSVPHTTADLPRLLHPVPVYVRSRAREVIDLIQQASEYSGSLEGLCDLVEEARVPKTEKEEEEEEVKEVKQKPVQVWNNTPSQLTVLVKDGAVSLQSVYHPNFQAKPAVITTSCQLDLLPQNQGSISSSLLTPEAMKEQEQMEQKQKQMCEEIEASLDLNEMFRDLAFISGTMGGESESDSEDEAEAKEEEAKEDTKEEEFVSLREAYRPTSKKESMKRPAEPGTDELLGVKKIDRKSNDSMKKSIGWKSNKAKKEL